MSNTHYTSHVAPWHWPI